MASVSLGAGVALWGQPSGKVCRVQAKIGLDPKKIADILAGMNTPREILEFVGLPEAAAALGVSLDRVDRAQRGEKLPAAWLDTLERLARRPLPRELFSFKSASRKGAA